MPRDFFHDEGRKASHLPFPVRASVHGVPLHKTIIPDLIIDDIIETNACTPQKIHPRFHIKHLVIARRFQIVTEHLCQRELITCLLYTSDAADE